MADARRYEDLAKFARDHGFAGVTAPAVHYWTKRGLVPPAAAIHYGFGRRAIVSSADTGRALLELCRVHFTEHIRDLDVVALRLWFAGFPVSSTAVRRGLGHAADLGRFERLGKTLAARRGELLDSPTDAIGTAAEALLRPLLASGLVAGPSEAADVTVGLSDYVARALGSGLEGEADPRGQEALGRLGGLTADETTQLPFVATLWDPRRVRDMINSSTDGDLLAARALATEVGIYLSSGEVPDIVRRLAASELAALIAVSFLALREYPFAAAALEAHVLTPQQPGARTLRYLR